MKYAQLTLSALARGFWPLFLRPAGVNANWSASILLFAIGIVSGMLLALLAVIGLVLVTEPWLANGSSLAGKPHVSHSPRTWNVASVYWS